MDKIPVPGDAKDAECSGREIRLTFNEGDSENQK